ncbi:MAG: universal stress protein [Gaiellaceae bacterium]
MTISATRRARQPVAGELFARVLVGVGDTPAALAAVRQGAILAGSHGTLELLAVYDASVRRDGPTPVFLDVDPDRERARRRLLDAARSLPAEITAATTTVVTGRLATALLEELELGHETVVAVAADSGATVTNVLYEAPCSVLVARPRAACSPGTIVVGVDGSPESALAYGMGKHLARRFGAQLRPLVALGANAPDMDAVAQLVGRDPEHLDLDPAAALVAAARPSDLLIVGGRGVHDALAVGSVTEQAAEHARCSVLVARSV